jgi:formate hydrogenlyase subunit 4
LVVALGVPALAVTHTIAGISDLFTVVAVLLVGTVWLILAALDTGTAFGGMGASRAITIAALVEPTLLLSVLGLAVPAGSTDLAAIMAGRTAAPGIIATPMSLLALLALVIVILAEAGRLPMDNPATHLELTMIHEAMILEYSGRDLALIEWAGWLRLSVFLTLLANLFLPWGLAPVDAGPAGLAVGVAAWGVKVFGLAAVLAVAEVFLAKVRLFRVPELLAGSFALAFLSVTAAYLLPVGVK